MLQMFVIVRGFFVQEIRREADASAFPFTAIIENLQNGYTVGRTDFLRNSAARAAPKERRVI